MKITVFLPSLSGGGAERSLLTVATELAQRGHHVLLVTAVRSPLPLPVPGLLRHECFDVGHARAAIPRLIRHLRRENPHVLLSAMDHGNLTAVSAARLSRTRVAVVVTYHATVSVAARRGRSLKQKMRPLLIRPVTKGAAGVVAVSTGVADDLRVLSASPGLRVDVIYNPTLSPALFEHAAASSEFPAPPSPFVLAVGRLVQAKGFSVLLDAFALVVQKRPDAHLLICGEGDLRSTLEQQVKRLRLTSSVTLSGFVHNPYPLMAACDAFVLSSLWEGLGNVLVEAGALGAPLVSTDCGGPGEILRGRPNGSLVPVEDAKALAEAILKALREPRTEPGSAGWEQHTVHHSVDAYEDLLHSVISGRK